MIRYGILTIYKCGRTKKFYVDAEDRESMWKKFYRNHKKETIDEASVYSEEIMDVLTPSKKQDLADKFTNEVLTAKYGERFTSLDDVEDDAEINAEWDFLNEEFYETITKLDSYVWVK